jgi:hypothetical protein
MMAQLNELNLRPGEFHDYAIRLHLTKILHWSGYGLHLFDSIAHFGASYESAKRKYEKKQIKEKKKKQKKKKKEKWFWFWGGICSPWHFFSTGVWLGQKEKIWKWILRPS